MGETLCRESAGEGDTQVTLQQRETSKWNLKANFRSLKELYSFQKFTGDRLG